MQRHIHELPSPSIGTQRQLVSFAAGRAEVPTKVYIQASLHAEELPGMLVAHHLRALLAAADHEGRIVGSVVLVPAANPIGLSQRLYHHPQGRFELDTAENFNRHYPDLAEAVAPVVAPLLTQDAETNTRIVREQVGRWLQNWVPSSELDALRRQLFLLAHDADYVLDLHCDCESVLHLYSEEICWPPLEPLARLLQAQAVLLARESGGGPFDERLSGLWWQLADRLKGMGVSAPLAQACASTTVELRGEGEVRHDLATQDAAAIMAFLEVVGVVKPAGNSAEIPPLPCEATPLSGSETLRAHVSGLLVFLAEPGQRLKVGDPVAELIDPTAEGQSRVHTVSSSVDGVFYARVNERYVLKGGEIGKIAGATPFRTGNLLGA